ncbi:MAG: DUF998 domain-containing protein [Steroidobacteraceae bacterium]
MVLVVTIAGLAAMLPAYSHVRQTVSEIGEIGSQARVPFAVALGIVALCILLFAIALRNFAVQTHSPRLVAFFVGCMAPSVAGVAVFAHPHPLHNVFGLSELIGYQAPLILAVTWRHMPRAKPIVMLSGIVWGLTWIAVALNFAPIEPYRGLAQRALFSLWFGWCAAIGTLLFRRRSMP